MAKSDIDASLVTVGKPVDGGCVYIAFGDSPTLPTDAVAKASTLTGFESLGEVDENGLTESKSIETTDFKGWHNDVLLTNVTGDTNTYKLAFVEYSRPAVAKLRYGDDSVAADADGNVTHVGVGSYKATPHPIFIDELLSNGWLHRTLIKKAVVTGFDDISHVQGSLMVNGMTLTANKPDDGSDAIEHFFAKPGSTAPVAVESVSLDKRTASVQVNSTVKLAPSFEPSNATDKTGTWTSDDDAIATVSGGTVTGKKAGSTVVTFQSTDGHKTASCSVTVTAASA